MGLFQPEPIDKMLTVESIKHAQQKAAEDAKSQAKEEAKKEVKRHEENKRQGMI
jgi:hypothetical protein